LDKQDIKLTKTLKRIPPNGGVFLPFGTYYFIKKLPLTVGALRKVGNSVSLSLARPYQRDPFGI